MPYVFVGFLGIFVRWILIYRCTFNKEKLTQLYKENKENRFYGTLLVILIILLFIILSILKNLK